MQSKTHPKKLAFTHGPGPTGGPGTFQKHLVEVLPRYGWQALAPGQIEGADALFVVIGTKKLWMLEKAKRRGIPVIHRLDGINWKHRLPGRPVAEKIIQEGRNVLVALIRRRYAGAVVYQSQYIQKTWHETYGKVAVPELVIYNGTDLERFRPRESFDRKVGGMKMLIVEGTVEVAMGLGDVLAKISEYFVQTEQIEEIIVVGKVRNDDSESLCEIPGVRVMGQVKRERMPEIFRQADLFFCLEMFPPCPNAVVEALASGLPVVGYDTGALGELVGPEAGVVAAFGGDPGRFERPSTDNIIHAINEVLSRRTEMAFAARARAEKMFSREMMVAKYLEVIERACGDSRAVKAWG